MQRKERQTNKIPGGVAAHGAAHLGGRHDAQLLAPELVDGCGQATERREPVRRRKTKTAGRGFAMFPCFCKRGGDVAPSCRQWHALAGSGEHSCHVQCRCADQRDGKAKRNLPVPWWCRLFSHPVGQLSSQLVVQTALHVGLRHAAPLLHALCNVTCYQHAFRTIANSPVPWWCRRRCT